MNTATNFSTTTVHGVFLNIFNVGVLISGAAGSGKSQLALELIDRGHQLIADDAPEFQRQTENVLGRCPLLLQDYLHIRHFGIINIRKQYGDAAICKQQILQLIITLSDNHHALTPIFSFQKILQRDIPEISIACQQNRALLVECAIRQYYTTEENDHPSNIFTTAQQALINA